MTTRPIVIPQATPAVITPRRHVRNGKFPTATFTRSLTDLVNHVARYRSKEVARYAITIDDVPASTGVAGTRTRARTFFLSSPRAARLWAIVTAFSGATIPTSLNPSIRIRCATPAGVTVADAEFIPGNRGSPGTFSPDSFTVSGRLEFNAAIPQSTELTLDFDDLDGAVAYNAVVYEESAASDNVDYTPPNVAALGPIFDATRESIATLARLSWRDGAAHLFNWTSGDNPTTNVRSTTSATPFNLIDGSADEAVLKIDLAHLTRSSTSSSGVLVKVWVYGMNTPAANGLVSLDQTGGGQINVGPFTGSFSWVEGQGFLDATNAELRLMFSTASGTLLVAAVSAYLFDEI